MLDLVANLQDAEGSLRMNDGKVDPAGRFWAGMMAQDHRPGAGTLYRLDPDLRVTPMVRGTSISNGLDWSPDARTMYYIDSTTRQVDRFAFDLDSGTIADRTTLIPIREGGGWPDGMCVDGEGFLWVALWDGWGVERYAPDGRLVEIVELKDHPWFVASQFHPEFRSRPERPHPLFDAFVGAALAFSAPMRAESRRLIWPAPIPTAISSRARRMAFDLTEATADQANRRSFHSGSVGCRPVATCQPCSEGSN